MVGKTGVGRILSLGLIYWSLIYRIPGILEHQIELLIWARGQEEDCLVFILKVITLSPFGRLEGADRETEAPILIEWSWQNWIPPTLFYFFFTKPEQVSVHMDSKNPLRSFEKNEGCKILPKD